MKSYQNIGALSFLAISLVLGSFVSVPTYASANVQNTISDSAITMSVKAEMAKNPAVSATTITVETNDGVVTLNGSAKTDAEATTAVEIAESTAGVKEVEAANLTVADSNQPITDSIITAKVKGKFVREKLFGDAPISVTDIKVETKDGVVYLSGHAKNKEQENNAIRLAKVRDVKNVVSHLKIQN